LNLCSTIVIKDVSQDIIRLRLFPFSLLGKAQQWFYKGGEAVDTWSKCAAAFLAKFFPLGKTNALRGKISSFQQTNMEAIPEAWERLQEYNGLLPSSRGHLDDAAGGAFLDLTIIKANELIDKMVSNQGWNDECTQTQGRSKGMHRVKETDMLAAILDALIKRIDDEEKARSLQAVHSIGSHFTCDVCDNMGHSGNDCPETREVAFMNNNNNFGSYRPQQSNWNQP